MNNSKRKYDFIILLLWVFFLLNIFGALLISLRIPNFFELYNNKSDSMLPTIAKNDLSIVKTGNNLGYKPGDIIVFNSLTNGLPTIITHRIVAIGGNVYITQGDNNPNGQEIVVPRQIMGKVIMILPYIGSYFAFLKSNIGFLIMIAIPAIFLFETQLYDIYKYLKLKK